MQNKSLISLLEEYIKHNSVINIDIESILLMEKDITNILKIDLESLKQLFLSNKVSNIEQKLEDFKFIQVIIHGIYDNNFDFTLTNEQKQLLKDILDMAKKIDDKEKNNIDKAKEMLKNLLDNSKKANEYFDINLINHIFEFEKISYEKRNEILRGTLIGLDKSRVLSPKDNNQVITRTLTSDEKKIIDDYLLTIKDLDELTEEENVKLYKLMQSNNIIERTEAREKLIVGNMKLAFKSLLKIINDYDKITNLEDLIDEVNIDLIKAVNGYDPNMGPLKNLLYFHIKRSISGCLKNNYSQMSVPTIYNRALNQIADNKLSEEEIRRNNKLSMQSYEALKEALLIPVDDEESFDMLRIIDQHDLKEVIDNLLNTLDEKESNVIKLRFGLNNGEIKTLDEIAKMYNISYDSVRGIEARALRHLRHPSRSIYLKDYRDDLYIK